MHKTDLLLCLWVSLALGCASLDFTGQQRDFEDAHKKYAQLIRWGELEKASAYVAEAQRTAFLSRAPDFENIRVTDYEIKSVQVAPNRDSATVHVVYRAYRIQSLTEIVFEETQTWNHNSQQGRWEVQPGIAALSQALRRTP